MSKEERHLQTKIRIFEDMLIRCKNFSQMTSIQAELTKMRIKLQKLEYERLELRTGALFFLLRRTISKGLEETTKSKEAAANDFS